MTKIKNILSLLIVVTLIQMSQTAQPTPISPTTMDNLLKIIDTYFFIPTPTYQIQIKKFLRSAFHDCMGGCDGSLNWFKTQNRGLEGLIKKMNQSFISGQNNTYINTYLSRPDYFVLVEQRALAWGIKNGYSIPPFQNATPIFIYGRKTNQSINSDSVEADFPDGIANWTSTSPTGPTTVLGGLLNGIKTINEKDVVILSGLHGTGSLNLNNSAYQGPWLQGPNVTNAVSNLFYRALFGVGYPNSTFLQFLANQSLLFTPSELNYYSPNPSPPYKMQWVGKLTTPAQVYINSDLAIYYNFTASPNGTVSGLYCPQGANTTLFNCNAKNSSYLPLSNNAQQGFNYAKNNSAYIQDLVPAFLRLVNSSNSLTTDADLRGFYPQIICDNGVKVCQGDIFMNNCGIGSNVSCT